MNEPRFITHERLKVLMTGEGETLSSGETLKLIEDFIYTLDKLFLAVETASEILIHMAELNRDKKEIEREDWKTRGEDLAYIRTQHDMSHTDMARVLDCPIFTLLDAERGKIDPTDLQRLAVEKLMKL